MSRKHTYTGVLVRENGEFVLINNGEDLSLTAELHYFWQKDIPLHITINNDVRTLLNEKGDFYLDRENKDSKYQYHINDISLEKILNNNINNFIKLEIEETAEDMDL
jgi:hypothetical protein